MIRVNGSLIKTHLKDADGYKFSVSPKCRYFNDLESAIRYSNNIYAKTGVILGIVDTTRKNLLKKIHLFYL